MKTNGTNLSKPCTRYSREILQRGFVAIVVVFSVMIMSCGNTSDEHHNIISKKPVFGGSGNSSNPISLLFRAAGKGAAGQVSGATVGWALGALGLSDGSPDYTEQLDLILQSLHEIIGQLDAVQGQLADINQQLKVLDCSIQQTSLTEQTGRIDYLEKIYSSMVSTAAAGGRVPVETLTDWVDQVMATGAYTGQTPMGQVLTTMANQLLQPSSGAITACIQAIPKPPDGTFDDQPYYDQAAMFTDYYYYYQAVGLTLLIEALHYNAWVAAGSPNSDVYPADLVYAVCEDSEATLECNLAASFTNAVYNALTNQFTAAGAPYTDDYFLMQYRENAPLLWVKSLEDFTVAAGDGCNDPLTSADPCGITAGSYNQGNGAIKDEVYRGYTNWYFASATALNELLAGWESGTAHNYLGNTIGFKNMNNKIVLSTDSTTISLNHSGANQQVVMFFDGRVNKNQINNKLFDDNQAFNLITPTSKRTAQGSCSPFASTFYTFTGQSPGTNSSWYNAWGQAEWCGSNVLYGGVGWYFAPPWLTSSGAKQYRMPLTDPDTFSCTEGRSSKNVGGVWSMCGDDFTAWYDFFVPRPETCDQAVGTTCNLDI